MPVSFTLLAAIALAADPGAADDAFRPSGVFAQARSEEVVRLVYPNWDAATGITRDGSSWRAHLDQARTWKTPDGERLAVLLGLWSGDPDERWTTAANGTLFCDLVLIRRAGDRLELEARAKRAVPCGGATTSRLDLAPYRMDERTLLLGVRSESMNHGYGEVTLALFRLEGHALRSVFSRVMETSDANTAGMPGTSATLTVETHPPDPSVFRVVEKRGRIEVVERWAWAGTQYLKQ